jgi:hypothetical protein
MVGGIISDSVGGIIPDSVGGLLRNQQAFTERSVVCENISRITAVRQFCREDSATY